MEGLLQWYLATTPQLNSEVSETRDVFEARAQKIFPSLLKNGFSETDARPSRALVARSGCVAMHLSWSR